MSPSSNPTVPCDSNATRDIPPPHQASPPPTILVSEPLTLASDGSGATTDFGSTGERGEPPTVAKSERFQGEKIANYHILAELGRGGMGVVYKAQDRRLKRLVALKVVLAGGHAGATERLRFQIEVEAAARLQHPNIVQVFEQKPARRELGEGYTIWEGSRETSPDGLVCLKEMPGAHFPGKTLSYFRKLQIHGSP